MLVLDLRSSTPKAYSASSVAAIMFLNAFISATDAPSDHSLNNTEFVRFYSIASIEAAHGRVHRQTPGSHTVRRLVSGNITLPIRYEWIERCKTSLRTNHI